MSSDTDHHDPVILDTKMVRTCLCLQADRDTNVIRTIFCLSPVVVPSIFVHFVSTRQGSSLCIDQVTVQQSREHPLLQLRRKWDTEQVQEVGLEAREEDRGSEEEFFSETGQLHFHQQYNPAFPPVQGGAEDHQSGLRAIRRVLSLPRCLQFNLDCRLVWWYFLVFSFPLSQMKTRMGQSTDRNWGNVWRSFNWEWQTKMSMTSSIRATWTGPKAFSSRSLSCSCASPISWRSLHLHTQ